MAAGECASDDSKMKTVFTVWHRDRTRSAHPSQRKISFRAHNEVWDTIGICSRHGWGGAGVSETVIFSNLRWRVDSFPTMLQA
jgi:hypothetical protein